MDGSRSPEHMNCCEDDRHALTRPDGCRAPCESYHIIPRVAAGGAAKYAHPAKQQMAHPVSGWAMMATRSQPGRSSFLWLTLPEFTRIRSAP